MVFLARVISIAALTLLAIGIDARPTRRTKSACTSKMRLKYAALIPKSYDKKQFGQTVQSFKLVPFALPCQAQIYANGAPGVIVSNSSESTRAFADETRQVFSNVTGEYTDFSNGTTIIHTNVTIGAAHYVAVPVTFSANVYLGFGLDDCQIYTVDAYATIPTNVLGLVLNPPALPPGTIP